MALFCAAAITLAAGTVRATATFNVNNNADEGDANRGDGSCATSTGVCTLRAAVDEANATVGMDIINIPADTYVLKQKRASSGQLLDNPLTLLDSVSIVGAGAATTTINGDGKTSILSISNLEAWVADSAQDRVVTFRYDGAANGVPVIPPGSGGLDQPLAMAFAGVALGGNLLISTQAAGLLQYDSLTGAFVATSIPPMVNGAPMIAGGWDSQLSTSPNDGLYVSNAVPGGGVLRFTPDTAVFQSTFISGTPGETLGRIRFITQSNDPFKHLLVLVTSHGVIRRYSPAGALEGTFASVPGARDMVVQDGIVYVSSESDDAVYMFDERTGASQGFLVPVGGGGRLDAPTFLAVAPDGNIGVASSGTNQILRYDGKTGAFLGVAAQGGGSFLSSVGPFVFATERPGLDGPTVNISGVTLMNGKLEFGQTAGMRVGGGTFVTMIDCVVRDNNSRQYGGGIGNFGNLTLWRVSVLGNTLPTAGTGGQTSRGGGIYNDAKIFIFDSLIANNFGGRGGGLFNRGEAAIINTTISSNKSDAEGGGLGNFGAVSISFSTIKDNQTHIPGSGTDTSSFGGGVYTTPPGYIFAGNVVVAGNSDNREANNADFSPDCYSPEHFRFLSYGNNFVGVLNAKCELLDNFWGDSRTIQSGTSTAPLAAGLGNLADNGGPTLTHMPEPGSPLIDTARGVTGNDFFTCGGRALANFTVDHDQRQQPRPLDGDSNGDLRCDIGAVEGRPAAAFDIDADGIDNAVDSAPSQYSMIFLDTSGGNSTSGRIVDTGQQLITVSDAVGAGVTVTAGPGGGAAPAVISACDGQVTARLHAGESTTITCVTANAGPDQIVECASGGTTPVTLDGSASSAAGGPPTFSWSVPGVTLANANQSVASGGFSVGTKTATLTVTRGTATATDTALVTVMDTKGPVLLVPPDVTATSCTSVSLGQAVAVDTCGGAVTIVNDAPASFKAGAYTVTWRAIDAFGNETTRTQQVTVGLGDNSACCPAGTHIINGTANNDTLNGTSGADCILGRGGQDTINGMGGNDTISGGDGDDVIDGGSGNDFIEGGPGQDTLRGGAGKDTLAGMDGDDLCQGGDDDDTIRGGAGQDRLFGENGNDTLFGEVGNDTLDGGAGNDTLNGGGPNDQCAGGTGTNVYLLCQNQPGSSGPLAASFAVTSDSGSGFCVGLSATNPTAQIAKSWGVTFNLTNATISSSRNGLLRGSTGTVTLAPSVSSNQDLSPGEIDTSISFCANRTVAGSPPPTVISTQATF